MASEWTPIDITNMPELAQVAEEVQRTRHARLLRRGEEPIALLVPAGRGRPRPTPALLVDTSSLPPVPPRTVDELAGTAGRLAEPLPWAEMRDIAREDALGATPRPRP
jgi:hypothetical protein